MAKLIDVIKKIFGDNLEKEVEDAVSNEDQSKDDKAIDKKDETVPVVTKDVKEKDVVAPETKKEDIKNEEDTTMKESDKAIIIEDGCYDESTGKIDISKIKDPNVANLISKLMAKDAAKEEAQLINSEIKSSLTKLRLSIKPETAEKLLDKSGIKIVNGKVYGVEEAIESLKKSDEALFIDAKKQSSPVNQGFSPVNKVDAGEKISYAEAAEDFK